MIEGATKRSLTVGPLVFSAWEMRPTGPDNAPLALCLHGFPDTARTWRLTLPALAHAGYRAVAVSMRGYEPGSLSAAGDYSMPALAGDVAGLLDALEADSCHLIGHDWGASIAYPAAVATPARIETLTTIAVPHPAAFAQAIAKDFAQLRRSWYIYFFQLRGWSDGAVRKNDFAFLDRLWRAWSPGWAFDPEDLAEVKRAFAAPGVLEAALGYYRTAFDPKHPRRNEAIALLSAPIRAPTLGITGALDGCIGPDVFERSMPPSMFGGGVRVERIAGAGHFTHLERPDAVNALILRHLQSG